MKPFLFPSIIRISTNLPTRLIDRKIEEMVVHEWKKGNDLYLLTETKIHQAKVSISLRI